ncbi:MAG: hypothetical protein A3G88_06305 [Omnitrophica WOR_2 bacterium RIFCSPLOWO2_12_FULL_63_16]|nr:MAG: hypothetical protein A3G88_06305 [Omnitrophica WOR_2 bacterium RIFCSPLOWO2_12_FULL_63_16]
MPIEIIAEAAQGYEGDPKLAQLLARGAVRAGADAVKFQLVYADELATPDYQHYALFQGLEMPRAVWQAVVDETHQANRRFYFDVFGERSLREAHALRADGVKIHSTDFFNAPLVRLALELMPRVFISFGGIAVDELDTFLQRHRIPPQGTVCLMYGFQADPTPIELNHLSRLGALRERFLGYQFGFMDHTDGSLEEALTVALLALPFGVRCIEKHIGLDRALQLEDYLSALSPELFQLFVQRIRRLEPALGTDRLELTPTEREYRQKAVKAVVAARAIAQGTVLAPEDLSLKRVARTTAANPLHRIEDAVGRTVTADLQPNQPVMKEMVG